MCSSMPLVCIRDLGERHTFAEHKNTYSKGPSVNYVVLVGGGGKGKIKLGPEAQERVPSFNQK